MPTLSALLVSGSMILPSQALPDLQHTEWRLQAPAQSAPLPTLSIADNRLSGFAGCNRFTLGIDQDGKHQVATTRMACAPEVMQREQALLKFLAAPFRLLPSENRQSLTLQAGKTAYRFLRVAAGATAAYPAPAASPAPTAQAAPSALRPEVGEQYWYVSSGTCVAGACLRLRSREDQPWLDYDGSILGFQPQPGHSYYLKLQGEPAADGGHPTLQLVRVIYQETAAPLAD
ncbi:META domain-containing protein [Chromobacterium paludis]|uniref:META domain-containing protein n=1 Tax=Chromobacterium paludis TaxID=2605945 RepID=A0A5C1DMT5_9NEIS|nr:META domain-containing protein [Chromobacterium paludis]QEL57369.1 META domain-containing protein [Chromobacterium paludis]